MEKIENRQKFIKEYQQFISLVKLTPEFLTGLEQHPYFKNHMSYVKDLPEPHKLSFILLELTRERSTCQAVINQLDTCGQKEAARRLSKFNLSSGPMPLIFDETLEVNCSVAPKKDLSNTYNLIQKRRGQWIIVNFLEEPQTPTVTRNGKEYKARGLDRETKRFKDLFEKLHFEVIVISKLSAQELKQRLQYISEDLSLERDEAFGLMIITHGEDEKIYGYDACDTMARMNHKQIRGDDPAAQEVVRRDLIDIKEIITIFSDVNCPQLRAKPKLFFFTCCRVNNSPNSSGGLGNKASGSPSKDPIKVTKQKSTMDTFVTYSCSQGLETFFDPFNGYSYFGQALSLSIAQYASEESLSQIMSRTQQRLTKIYNENESIPDLMGSFAIEMNLYAMNNQLYFNPGIYEGNVGKIENEKTDKTQLGRVDKVNDHRGTYALKVLDLKQVTSKFAENLTLMRKIGSGGYGKVYEAEEKILSEKNKSEESRRVALKKILMEKICLDHKGKNHEIQLMRELQSEYVVQLDDYWVINEAVFIKMELCDANLKDIIELKETFFSHLPMMDYIFSSLIFIEVLECVDYLHSRNPPVIHRDLKPSNFLVKYVPTNNRFIKATDFGISILNDINERTRITKNVGTFNNMAPELINSDRYNEKVDIFSLSTLAYQLFRTVDKDIFVIGRNEYKELYQIRQLMKGDSPLMRPSCKEILESRAKWTIDQKEISVNYVLSKFPKTINSEEYKFIKIFLESKLGPIPNTV